MPTSIRIILLCILAYFAGYMMSYNIPYMKLGAYAIMLFVGIMSHFCEKDKDVPTKA